MSSKSRPEHNESAYTQLADVTADMLGVRLRARFRLMHRSKQLELFDHFLAAGRQKMRDCDLAELTRVKRVNFPKAICA
jgi:hypothetical protein